MVTVELLCLACSWRGGGRCVAGVDGEQRWIRPVSAGGGALRLSDCRLDTGELPRPFDILEIGLERPAPTKIQPENWEIAGTPWRRADRLDDASAFALLDRLRQNDDLLFGNGGEWVDPAAFDDTPCSASLTVIRPESVRWYGVRKPSGRVQMRGVLSVGSEGYDLPLTDPEFQPDDGGSTTSPLLTVSLGEPYFQTGRCYKIIAAVTIP